MRIYAILRVAYLTAAWIFTLCIGRSVQMNCVHQSSNLLLDDVIHISDVVLTGKITAMREEDNHATKTATIAYYYAYKRDREFRKAAGGIVEVSNFVTDSKQHVGLGLLFFLVREPQGQLALLCMAPLDALLTSDHSENFQNALEALDHVKNVGVEDNRRNEQFVPPDPSPCDSTLTNYCSLEGSQCSVVNTLPGEPIRCTCLTGYVGDGMTCNSLTQIAALEDTSVDVESTNFPPSPPTYTCSECQFGAFCMNSSSSLTTCDCSHFHCTGEAGQPLCDIHGVTHGSRCEIILAECQQQRRIYTLHEGRCGAVIPCGGTSLPLIGDSGVESCGEEEDECPPMYFCHSTGLISVCCPVTPPGNHSDTVAPSPSTSSLSLTSTILLSSSPPPRSVLQPTATPSIPTASPVQLSPTHTATPQPTPISSGSGSGSGSGYDGGMFSGSGGSSMGEDEVFMDDTLMDDEDNWTWLLRRRRRADDVRSS